MEDDATNREERADTPVNGDLEKKPTPDAGCLQSDDDRKRYDELHDRYLRLAADFENFRKRTLREQEHTILHANEQFALDMLDIVDNLERAMKYDDSHIREGLEQIWKLSEAIMNRHGITAVESLDKPFDPAVHEAIAHVPSDKPEGTVIDETAKGYRMHDKVIRYAKVAVSKGNEKKE